MVSFACQTQNWLFFSNYAQKTVKVVPSSILMKVGRYRDTYSAFLVE